MGRVLSMGYAGKTPREPRPPRDGDPIRHVFASLALAGLYDRVCRSLGRTRPVGAAASSQAGRSPHEAVSEAWKVAFPIVSFVIGMGALATGALGGHVAYIGIGLVLAGLGPAGLGHYLLTTHDDDDDGGGVGTTTMTPSVLDLDRFGDRPPAVPLERWREFEGPDLGLHRSPFPMPRMTDVHASRSGNTQGHGGLTEDRFADLAHGGTPFDAVGREQAFDVDPVSLRVESANYTPQPRGTDGDTHEDLAQRLERLGEHELAKFVRQRAPE